MAIGVTQYPGALDTVKTLVEVANDAVTTLTAPLGIGDTVAQVANTSRFSNSGFAVFESEIASFDGKTPTTLTNLVRGQQGTVAAGHASGVDVEQMVTARDHNVLAEALIAMQEALENVLISVVWGTPVAEAGNAIEIAATCVGLAGSVFESGLVDVKLVVSDAANDGEPSHTAIITAANAPVGTVLSGAGTATVIVRTDNNGQFKIKVSEPAAASRYLWTTSGGHSRLWVRSSTGVQQLTFV